jgi:uncharacterized membrane-anchored protein
MDISGCGRFSPCRNCTCSKPTVKPKPTETNGRNTMMKIMAALMIAGYLALVSMATFADMTRVSDPVAQVQSNP